MTQQISMPETPTGPARFADAFVIFSVTLLSMALGAWLISRSGLALWSVLVMVLSVYAALLAFHLIVRRSFASDRSASPAHDDSDWLGGEPAEGALPRQSFTNIGSLGDDFDAGVAPPLDGAAARTAGTGRTGSAPPPAEPADPFKFRPTRARHNLKQPQPATAPPPPPAAARQPQPAHGEPLPLPPLAMSELSVKAIEDQIKKLADAINATEAQLNSLGVASDADSPAGETAAGLDLSVAALESTAQNMRSAVSEPAAAAPVQRAAAPPAPPGWWPVANAPAAHASQAARTGAPPSLNPQLARIAEAVAAERMEVLLEPIQALAEGRTRHFEVSVRLLTADGASLEPCDFARAAQGSGLMPRIDVARMIRAARVARRLGERGRQGSVLAAVAGESLTDAAFLDTAAAQAGADGMRLVLSFVQGEVRAFTPGHAAALSSMAASGFAFALEEVTDLDMDFGALKGMGFEFVKLDAPVFLEGLPAAGGQIPAADICRYLAGFGLTLIVGRIEDDWLLARILGLGVLLGKGTVFGGPKLVRADVVAEPAAA